MPLLKSKSAKAFSHNVGAEMDAGKPPKQALAIAYSIKRRNRKNMNEGEQVQKEKSLGDKIVDVYKSFGAKDETPHEEMNKDKANAFSQGFKNATHSYSEGGEVEEPIEEMHSEMENKDDFLSDEDSESPFQDASDENEPHMLLSRIINKIRMRHMGK
jgi:hypothetical protein